MPSARSLSQGGHLGRKCHRDTSRRQHEAGAPPGTGPQLHSTLHMAGAATLVGLPVPWPDRAAASPTARCWALGATLGFPGVPSADAKRAALLARTRSPDSTLQQRLAAGTETHVPVHTQARLPALLFERTIRMLRKVLKTHCASLRPPWVRCGTHYREWPSSLRVHS